MNKRKFVITTNGVEITSTNDRRHALRLVAAVAKGDLDDNRPEPKYRWLKEDILEARH